METNRDAAAAILSEYDAVRMRNERLARERREALYKAVPEFKELDLAIGEISRQRAVRYINGDNGAFASLKEEINALMQKKDELLLRGGYPLDYLSPIYDCKECRDTGFVQGRKCRCFRQKMINRRYLQSNIMEKLKKENFSNFRLDVYSPDVREKMEKLRLECLKYAEDFGSGCRNLLFLGKVGSGKTFLSNCIAKAVLDRGFSVLYFTAFRLFSVLADYTFRRGHEETGEHASYNYIFDADLLIIDDLGTEGANSFVGAQLFLILNERELRLKPTIISSNLSLMQLKEDYSERTFSRLLSGYEYYLLESSDIRLNR